MSVFPNFTQIYIGDSISLRCPSQGEGEVKWFHNNKVVPEWKDKKLTIPVVARKHSGRYHCEGSGVTSSSSSIAIKVQGNLTPPTHRLLTSQIPGKSPSMDAVSV